MTSPAAILHRPIWQYCTKSSLDICSWSSIGTGYSVQWITNFSQYYTNGVWAATHHKLCMLY